MFTYLLFYLSDVKTSLNSGSLFAVETAPEQQTLNRGLILQDIIESERNHIEEIQNLIKTVLTPLGTTDLYDSLFLYILSH